MVVYSNLNCWRGKAVRKATLSRTLYDASDLPKGALLQFSFYSGSSDFRSQAMWPRHACLAPDETATGLHSPTSNPETTMVSTG